jgi:cytochrome c oxidase accessory protein FixG
VFIDGLYRKIEIWVEGDYVTRRKLRQLPMSFMRIRASTLKWTLFLIVSSILAHSLIAYFTGSRKLLEMIQAPPHDNWAYFLIVSSVTALLLFNFGWFREQFCTIMCPYGRFQSVLMDNDSFTVLYDEARGEPRKGTQRDSLQRGDCVSCNRCVEVCPAGIDIRKGVQLECIGCTACIDACNAIMKRVNKPQNLIRYQSLNARGLNLLRPRLLVYMTLASLMGGILLYVFFTHEPYSLTILRGSGSPYQELSGEVILNHVKFHFFNHSQSTQEFEIKATPELRELGIKTTQASNASTTISSGQASEVHLFVSIPRELFKADGEMQLQFIISETRNGLSQTREFKALGPKGQIGPSP